VSFVRKGDKNLIRLSGVDKKRKDQGRLQLLDLVKTGVEQNLNLKLKPGGARRDELWYDGRRGGATREQRQKKTLKRKGGLHGMTGPSQEMFLL